ncbi:DUF29 domain-containing protein [Trinickia symbiotica]|uniref:DUF29 domain-containing protein n=1 Tax=Trinickia symbiotica TaxID=863227 RepID=UPI0021598685|nr:DUF29 domain-containing protein [Trinickia symbiotica]
MLKWQYQPALRGKSWTRGIAVQRKDVVYVLNEAPSLRRKFNDAQWLELVWSKAVLSGENETGLEESPETCPWTLEHDSGSGVPAGVKP